MGSKADIDASFLLNGDCPTSFLGDGLKMDLVENAMQPRTRLLAVFLAILALVIVIVGALLGQLFPAPLVGRAVAGSPDTQVGASLRELAYLIAGFGPIYVLLALAVWVRERRSFGYLFRFPRHATAKRYWPAC